jgi:CIC family chloride channel protein
MKKSTEIFYKRDFEVEALLPSLIAAVTGFTIFGSFFGWSPIFDISQNVVVFDDPSSLALYALLGLVCAAGGVAYVNSFYRIQSMFQRLRLPNFIKPAIGGAIVGVIAMFVPHVLGTGYGWLQIGIFDDPMFFPLWMLLGIALLKILATSFSIGSGGSAGIFGPGLVIGGFLGAFVATGFHDLGLFESVDVSTVAIIGMVAFFGGVSKSPLSTVVIGSEMTRGYALLPAMIVAVVIAYSVMKLDTTIYQSQVTDRSQSLAHKKEYQIPLLKKLLVKDSMNTDYPSLPVTSSVSEAAKKLESYGTENLLVTENQKFVGVVNKNDLNHKTPETIPSVLKDIDASTPDESLYDVMKKMSKNNTNELPVIDFQSKEVFGIISLSGIMRVYDLELGEPKDKKKRLSGST